MVPSLRTTVVPATIAAAVIVVGVTFVASGGGGHSAVADPGTPVANTVSVDGTGTVQGVPDRLTATFGVHVTRGSVHDALDDVATDAKRLISALRHSGVAARDLRSTDLELNPHYDDHGRTNGYDAAETVVATFADLSSAGREISAVASSAGDAVTVNGLSFDLSSDTSLLSEARAAAYADAKARAKQYADLSGRALGSVQRITETILSPDQPDYRKAYDSAAGSAGAAAAPVPIAAGQQPVTVVVTVVWQLT